MVQILVDNPRRHGKLTPFILGWLAAETNTPALQCPYPGGTQFYIRWMSGYRTYFLARMNSNDR